MSVIEDRRKSRKSGLFAAFSFWIGGKFCLIERKYGRRTGRVPPLPARLSAPTPEQNDQAGPALLQNGGFLGISAIEPR